MPVSLARCFILAGLLLAVALPGCARFMPAQVVDSPAPEVIADSPLPDLLQLQDTVTGMSAEQVERELASMNKPSAIRVLFYYGLLNQQSLNYPNWITARDVFRQLGQDERVTEEERQLAGILERFNQNRINWHERYSQLRNQQQVLQQQLLEAEQHKALLEQKIQAITDLEAAISTRREQ